MFLRQSSHSAPQAFGYAEAPQPAWQRNFEDLPCPVVVLSTAGRVLYANPDFNAMFENARRTVRDLSSFVCGDDVERVGEIVRLATAAPGSTKSLELRIVDCRSGVHVFRSLWRYSAVYDSVTVVLDELTFAVEQAPV